MKLRPPIRPSTALAAAVLTALVSLATAPNPAVATPAAAQKIALQAKKAYDSEQFDRAADLYLAAHREQAVAGYLYAAARAAHQAGKLDRAEELYRRALQSADLPAEMREKAGAHLESIATRRAEQRADEAEALQKATKYAEAAEVWRSAAALQPGRAVYLCRAGRAAKLAGDRAAAVRDYSACRGKAGEGTAEIAEAERALAELEPPTPEKPTLVKAAEGPVVVAPPKVAKAADVKRDLGERPDGSQGVVASASPRRAWQDRPATTWAALGGGLAATAVGVGVLVWAALDEGELNAKIDARIDGKVTKISYADAQTTRDGINLRYGLGWASFGLGAAALGAGTWLYVKGNPPKVVLVPTGQGALLSARF